MFNDLLRLPHQAGTLNRLGGHEAPLGRHQKGAVAVVDLQVAFLRGGLHLLYIGAVLLPNVLKGLRDYLFPTRLLKDLVNKVKSGHHLGAALINDSIRGQLLPGLEHHGRSDRRNVEGVGQLAACAFCSFTNKA